MSRRPPRFTRSYSLFPYTQLFRARGPDRSGAAPRRLRPVPGRDLMRRLRLLSLALVLALAAVACDVQTASAPTGDLDLYATFDDVQDLARGTFVEMSDVPAGTAAGLELDGYRVGVQLTLEDALEADRKSVGGG